MVGLLLLRVSGMMAGILGKGHDVSDPVLFSKGWKKAAEPFALEAWKAGTMVRFYERGDGGYPDGYLRNARRRFAEALEGSGAARCPWVDRWLWEVFQYGRQGLDFEGRPPVAFVRGPLDFEVEW